MQDQKQVWDNIAQEWHEFKEIPAQHTVEFLEKQTGKVLDLGSGSGRHLMNIKNGEMYLVDFSNKMIELAMQKSKQKKIKAQGIVADITKLPFEDEFFDSAISISALHCLNKKQQEKAIQELHRVLKPNAKCFIGVWNKKSKRFKRAKSNEKLISWRDKGQRYYYLFTEEEVHNLFNKTDFKITSTINSEMMIRFIAEKL